MRAGQLTERISFEELKETRSDTNELLMEWSFVCSAWAAVVPLSGTERAAGKEIEGEVTLRVEIRARKNVTITSDMRIKHGSQYYEIVAPPPAKGEYSRGRKVKILCKEFTG